MYLNAPGAFSFDGEISMKTGRFRRFSSNRKPGCWAHAGEAPVSLADLLFLWFEEACVGRWSWQSAEGSSVDRVCDQLLKSLPSMHGWRERLRVQILGFYGYGPADRVLATTLGAEGTRHADDIRDARRQIALRAACDPSGAPPAGVVAAYLGPDEWWASWGRDVLLAVYGERFVDFMRGWMNSAVEDFIQIRMLLDAEELFPDRAQEIARLGLRARWAGVRHRSAVILRDTDTVVGILLEKGLVRADDFSGRIFAAIDLPLEPPPSRSAWVRGVRALLRVLRDKTDDVRVRGFAARSLARALYEGARPVLAAVTKEALREWPPRSAVYLGEPDPGRREDAAQHDWIKQLVIADRELRVLDAAPSLRRLCRRILQAFSERVRRNTENGWVQFWVDNHNKGEDSFVSWGEDPRKLSSREYWLLEEMAETLAWLGGEETGPLLAKLADLEPEQYPRRTWFRRALKRYRAMESRDLDGILESHASLGSEESLSLYLSALFSKDALRARLAAEGADRLTDVARSALLRALAR